jgi:hypothetical protein
VTEDRGPRASARGVGKRTQRKRTLLGGVCNTVCGQIILKCLALSLSQAEYDGVKTISAVAIFPAEGIVLLVREEAYHAPSARA